jgi:hypothetical protein
MVEDEMLCLKDQRQVNNIFLTTAITVQEVLDSAARSEKERKASTPEMKKLKVSFKNISK